MRALAAKIVLILLLAPAGLRGQHSGAHGLVNGELRMTFPSVYFKNNSTDYAAMPYTADSCFKYIAAHIKDINSYVIWRDSSETEELTNKRIKKLKTELNNYTPSGKIKIRPMGEAQKISRRTIDMGVNPKQIQYLLSLNSVFDVSGVVFRVTKKSKKNHALHPKIWCWRCWKRRAFFK